jgi:hypothetical protein
VKELEDEKNKLSKKITQEEKIDQKISSWNADGSFPVSIFLYYILINVWYLIKTS